MTKQSLHPEHLVACSLAEQGQESSTTRRTHNKHPAAQKNAQATLPRGSSRFRLKSAPVSRLPPSKMHLEINDSGALLSSCLVFGQRRRSCATEKNEKDPAQISSGAKVTLSNGRPPPPRRRARVRGRALRLIKALRTLQLPALPLLVVAPLAHLVEDVEVPLVLGLGGDTHLSGQKLQSRQRLQSRRAAVKQ